jgi:gamma-glutamyl:cysteine ligase YbdK (ATP-grasp superfamily)
MDISSQQIVLGVTSDRLGIELHNFFRDIGPVLVALTASSRFESSNNSSGFNDSGLESRRMGKYEEGLARYPRSTIEVPRLESTDHYEDHRKIISDQVKLNLSRGTMDANYSILSSSGHSTFDLLAPHQIFWHVRPRPDLAGYGTSFVLEVRSPDLPTTIIGMQTLNAFVIGLAYHIEKYGADSLPRLQDTDFRDMILASKSGLNTRISGSDLRTMAAELWIHAESALISGGYDRHTIHQYSAEMGALLEHGSYSQHLATMVREGHITHSTEMVNTLARSLRPSP